MYNKNIVKGPKINPFVNTAKLGRTIIGIVLQILKFNAAKINDALTIVPTSSCGCPIKKGTKKQITE